MRKKSVRSISTAFVLAVLAAAAAGCQSSSKSAAGDAGVAATQTPTTAQSQTAAAAPPSGAATKPASAAASTAPATPRATAAATSGSTPAKGSTGGSRTTPAPGKPTGFTRPGTYTYDLSGTATQPFGGTKSVSGAQSYVVDRPSGSAQHSKASSQNGSQDMTLTVRSTGLYVDDIHITQQGFDEDFRPTGTALYFPAAYRTGSHWSWQAKSTDGKFTLDVTTRVSGSDSQTVGGKTEKALIVDSTLHITGSGVDITSQQRDWVSTTYALVLKEHGTTNGTAYGAKISSDITRTLRSTEPS